MPITDRNLTPGTRLVANYKKQRFIAEVQPDGFGLLEPSDHEACGHDYKSPSALGSAIMGGIACNGWRFWSLEGEMAEGEALKPASAKSKAKAVKVFYRSPNQKGLSDNEVRFYCNACACGFIKVLEDGAEVEACPNGHRNDDAELTAAC